jgi:hypothetical protein
LLDAEEHQQAVRNRGDLLTINGDACAGDALQDCSHDVGARG